MGAPVLAATTLANTRTGRKIMIGALLLFALATGLVLTP